MSNTRSKRYRELVESLDLQKIHTVNDAFKTLCDLKSAKFDETVDVAFKLGVDPRHADQMIRGALVLPEGRGKTVVVAVIASGEKILQAEKAGADFAGGEELIKKISDGWVDFDRLIATPDMMGKIGRVGRILGPRGLMPNPKLGTVTPDVAKAVAEQKAGKVEFRTEKTGIIHVPIGKKSFGAEKLAKNFAAISNYIIKAKPTSSKGTYLQSLTLSSTMGPGIKVDTVDVISKYSQI